MTPKLKEFIDTKTIELKHASFEQKEVIKADFYNLVKEIDNKETFENKKENFTEDVQAITDFSVLISGYQLKR